MVTYLLFDADNTLFDFDQTNHRALERTCSLNGLPFTEESHALYNTINNALWREFEQGLRPKETVLTERFRRFGAALGIAVDSDKCARDQSDGLALPPILMEDAEEVCRRLSERCSLFLITNAVARVQRSRFAQSPLPPYFRDVFISEDIGCGKPDPRFFQYVFDHVPGISRENCLVIGDGPGSDIRGANNFGLPCCWFNPKGHTLPADLHADYTITRLTELFDIL